MMTQEVSPLMMFDQLRQSVQVSAKPTKKRRSLMQCLQVLLPDRQPAN